MWWIGVAKSHSNSGQHLMLDLEPIFAPPPPTHPFVPHLEFPTRQLCAESTYFAYLELFVNPATSHVVLGLNYRPLRRACSLKQRLSYSSL